MEIKKVYDMNTDLNEEYKSGKVYEALIKRIYYGSVEPKKEEVKVQTYK